MAVMAVSITKSAQRNGEDERFANIYHYRDVPAADGGGLDITPEDAQAIADVLVGIERSIFATQIAFREVRIWGPTEAPPDQNETFALLDLDGTGEAGTVGGFPLESCFEVSIKTRRESIRGRPVYLRKWLRTRSALGTTTALTNDMLARIDPLAQEHRDALRSYMRGIAAITGLPSSGNLPNPLILCSPTGRRVLNPDNPDPFTSQYLESHDVKYYARGVRTPQPQRTS